MHTCLKIFTTGISYSVQSRVLPPFCNSLSVSLLSLIMGYCGHLKTIYSVREDILSQTQKKGSISSPTKHLKWKDRKLYGCQQLLFPWMRACSILRTKHETLQICCHTRDNAQLIRLMLVLNNSRIMKIYYLKENAVSRSTLAFVYYVKCLPPTFKQRL